MSQTADYSYIDKNYRQIADRIAAAERECGREVGSVTLVPAVKSADVGEILHLCEISGIRRVAENRVQQFTERYDALNAAGITVDFIGTLQTNKVKYLAGKVGTVQSVDSEKLLGELEKQAEKKETRFDIFIEINSGDEEQKSGVSPADVPAFAEKISLYPRLTLRGFMTMAPKCTSDAEYRAFFKKTRELAETVWRDVLGKEGKPLLSMGMSESFEPAVLEGADIVRVGRSLFKKPAAN